jgi:hypothetical protein
MNSWHFKHFSVLVPVLHSLILYVGFGKKGTKISSYLKYLKSPLLIFRNFLKYVPDTEILYWSSSFYYVNDSGILFLMALFSRMNRANK